MSATGELLVERDAQLGTLRAALDALEGGDGALLAVEGAAGIGKTSLLVALTRRATGAGRRVLIARGADSESGFAFEVLRRLSDQMADGVAGLAPDSPAALAAARLAPGAGAGDAAGSSPEAAHALVRGAYWLFVELVAEHGPVVVVVDDAHWVDPLSLRALGYLARRLDGLPVLVAIAARPAADAPALGELLLAAHERIALEPLGPAGTRALAEARTGGAVSGAGAAACFEATGGNPFLVTELVRAVGGDLTAEAVAGLGRAPAASLGDAVMPRVRSLPAEAVALARALAVLGDGAAPDLAATLAGQDAGTGRRAARALLDAGFLERGGATLGFAHPLVRAAVDHDLGPAERDHGHDRAYRLLRDRHADDERLARHLLACSPKADPARAVTLLAAGRTAAGRGAHADAVALLRRAAAEPPAEADRPQVLLALGEAERQGGEPEAAAERLRDALAVLPPGSGRIRAGLALAGALSDRQELRAAVAALREAGHGLDADGRLRLDVERTTLELYDPELAPAAQARMRRFAELPGETAAQRIALANAGMATAFDPSSAAADARGLAARAVDGGRLVADVGCESASIGQALYALVMAEDLELAERVVAAVDGDANARGSVFGQVTAGLGHLMFATMRGRVVAAIGAGEATLRLLDELPGTPWAARWSAAVLRFLGEALLERGDHGQAERMLAAAGAGRDLDDPQHVLVRFTQGLLAAGAGEHDAALGHFEAYARVVGAVGYEERNTPWRVAAATSALALGDRERAAEHAAAQLEISRAWGAPGDLGRAEHVAALAGDRDAAVERLAGAEALLARSPFALARARATIDRGLVLRRLGHRREARAVLTDGLDRAAACGAVRLAGHARAELHMLGARPRRDRVTGRDALTPTELRIAALAVEGHTNRRIAQLLFVTPKTVEGHLSSVYRKLGVAGRGALGDALEAGAAA